MSKEIAEKYLDKRVSHRYVTKGTINKKDVESYLKELPNDEDNFDLVMFEEDDIGVDGELSDEELEAMPAMTEDKIDNFDFMEDKKEGSDAVEFDTENFEKS